MSEPVLTVEQVAEHKQEWSDSYTFIGLLCDSHEALRAELTAERADADRLAAALRLVSDFDCTNGGWQSCGGRCPSCIAGETIAAHDARRAK